MTEELDSKEKKVNELMDKLFGLLTEMNLEKNYSIKFFLFIIRRIPRTIFVEKEYRQNGCFIQGVVRLYADAEFASFSEEGRKNKEIAFRFLENDKAITNEGFYTGTELFCGTWIETLRFLLMKINESNSFLNRKQQQQLKSIVKILNN
jgi:hypothetical protein